MKKQLSTLYILLLIVCLPSLYYWLEGLSWSLNNLTLLNTFPLFGLLAFSIMWFHLMVAWYKRNHPEEYDYRKFFRQTSNLVLIFIILHPLLLIAKSLSIDLKPLDYSGPEGVIFILMGSLGLTIFLLYEFIDRARDKAIIKDNWPFVVAANRVGMILIFFHALKLGTHLQNGPFQILWYFFGLTMFSYFIASYIKELRNTKQ